MALVIVYARPDGGVSVLYPAPEMEIEDVAQKDVPPGAPWVIVDSETLPRDRTWRDAWVGAFAGGKVAIEVDMDKARAVHRDRLRVARFPLMQALDIDSMRATEQGKPLGAIAARKQTLRDVTADPRIEAAKTPEALAALTLDVLAPA